MKHIIAAIALSAATLLGPPLAQATSHAGGPLGTPAVALSDGEVRKVDKEAKKLTIRHAPLDNLGMPAMTMVFQVADPSVLERVKSGDKVRFSADKVGGAYRVIELEHAK
ncbi:MAG TPA: copper-binding protein [Burkholderiales bacterium]|nr:copper-binding protein [Burkholderiales bacterium]